MKKGLIRTIAVLAVGVCAIPNAFAENTDAVVSCESGSLVIKVNKDFGTLDYPADVTVTAYDKNGKLNFIDIVPVGTDGKIELEYYNTGISGDYTFNFIIDNFDIHETAVLNGFIGTDYWEGFCSDVNTLAGNADAANLKSRILDEVNLSLDLTEYNTLADEESKDRVFSVMIADIDEAGYKSAEEVKAAFSRAVEFVKHSNDAKAYYELAGTRLEIPTGEDTEKTSVLDEVSQKARNAVFSAVNKVITKCSGEKQVSEEFKKHTLYTVIENAEHYNDVKYVLNAYTDAGIIDIDKDMSADIYKALMGKEFSTEKEIKTAISKVKNNSDSKPPSKGNGGGGGAVSTPIKKVEPAKPVEAEDGAHSPQMRFSDMEDAKWALEQVDTLCEKGIISGVGDGKFEPHRYVSREEFAKMLCLLGGYEIETADIPFKDVESDSWSYPYIATAYKNGMINGVSDSEFAPKAMVSREQAVVMLYRILGDDIEKASKDFRFDDDNSISQWAKDAVYTLREKEIISGRTSKTFVPSEAMTRVEAAALLFGAGEKIIWVKGEN